MPLLEMKTVTITRKGQISIPKRIRDIEDWDQYEFGAQKMYPKNPVTLVKSSLHFPIQF